MEIIYAVEIFDNHRIHYLEIEHLYFDSVRMKAHGIYVYIKPSILERKRCCAHTNRVVFGEITLEDLMD